MANCALAVKYRHLNFVTPPLVVMALADEKLAMEERQGLGRRVAEIAGALSLACGWRWRFAYLPSESNPADAPSRWW